MKVFPEDWQVSEANTVCSEIVDCLNKTAPTVEHDTGYRMIRTTNIRNGRVDVKDNRFVEESVFAKWTRRARPKRGDVILSREAPLGEVGMLRSDAPVFLGQRTMLYRADPSKLDQNYLFYQMAGPYVQAVIQGKGQGSTVAHLRVPDAETLPIPIAPLKAQKKIAAILTAYDDLIENNQRRIAALEKMAEEIYREWFVRLRFPGHEKVKLVKGVPEGWRIEPLGKLVSEIIDYRGVTPEKLGTQWSAEGITALSALNVKNGRLIKLEDTYKASDSLYERWMRKELQLHDILLTSEAPLGQVYMLMDSQKYVLSQRLFALRADPEKIQACYLYHYLLGPVGQGQLAARATGSTVGGIRQQLLRQIEVLLPPSGLQESYGEAMLPILNQIHALSKMNTSLRQTRDLLLPRLISGKLRVDDLDIQFPPSMKSE